MISRSGQLTSSQVTTVTIAGDYTPLGGFSVVEITNRDGTAEIWFTIDGTEPALEGDDVDMIPAAVATKILELPDDQTTPLEVKLISPGNPSYLVALS